MISEKNTDFVPSGAVGPENRAKSSDSTGMVLDRPAEVPMVAIL
jgi:hypothetical protein